MNKFRHTFLHRYGYIVYLATTEKFPHEALVYKRAQFVEESDAIDYCEYRNQILKERGTTDISSETT